MVEGVRDRRLRERLGALLGERGAETGAKAVRHSELEALVLEIIRRDTERRAAAVSEDDAENPHFLSSFHEPDRTEGFYSWNFAGQWGGRSSRFPPPEGKGGGAAFLERRTGTGTWLATITDRGRGDNEPRLMAKATSGVKDDYGDWREFYNESNVIMGGDHVNLSGSPYARSIEFGADNVPRGPLFELIQTTDGAALRCSNGWQWCWHLPEFAYTSFNTSLDCEWTFPAAFDMQPFLGGSIPTGNYATYTGCSAADIMCINVEPYVDNTGATFRLRRHPSATAFGSGDSVSQVPIFAYGRWFMPNT